MRILQLFQIRILELPSYYWVGRSPNAESTAVRRLFSRSSPSSADFISSIAQGATMSHSFGSLAWFTSFHSTNSIPYLAQSSKMNIDLCGTTRALPRAVQPEPFGLPN